MEKRSFIRRILIDFILVYRDEGHRKKKREENIFAAEQFFFHPNRNGILINPWHRVNPPYRFMPKAS